MSTYLNIALTVDMDADMLVAQAGQNADNPADSMENLTNLLAGITSGTLNKGSAVVNVGGAPSAGTLTYSGQPSNNETFVLNGVTFTYKTTGAVANEVNIGQQISETMSNTAASRVSAIQSTLTLSGLPTAGQTFTLCGYTFTAIANGADRTGPLQFNIGSDATTTGDNIEAAWNTYAATLALATATNAAGTVTFDSTAGQGQAITAINTAASINASVTAKVANVVTASASGSVVTIRSLGQGKGTLLYTLTTSATNTTAGAFAGGLDGTQYSYTL